MTLLSRRATFSGLAAVACTRPVSAQSIGPDATLYGAPDYPLPPRELARREGNPWSPKYRVGAFTHLDEIYETRKVARAAEPWPFKHAAASQPVSFVTEYLARNPVMGLLVAKDDRILIEQYQYGRTDRDRFVSQSMVKSITSLLVGLAIADGAIRSVDDTPDMYVPGFKGSEYGRTPLRALLHMSSGVDFGEERDGGADLNRLWRGLVGGMPRKDTIGSIVQFDRRIAPPGRRYHYASIEPDVLGVVVRQTTGRSMAGYLQEKIWQPIGAESDATWLLDAEGGELAHFGFSAVLRDYARLGRLLAHDGAWNGKQLISAQWLTPISLRAAPPRMPATVISSGCCRERVANSQCSALSASGSSSIRRPSS